MNREHFFIGGQWAKPHSDRQFNLINASTGATCGVVPEASEADVDAAVAAARQAFDQSDWPTMSGAERAAIMGRFAEAIAKRGEDIAKLVSTQNGMPLSVSTALEGQFSVGALAYYTELTANLPAVESRPSQSGAT